jgi:hypothetical protein
MRGRRGTIDDRRFPRDDPARNPRSPTMNLKPRYHHMGIPTDKPRPGEAYLEKLKLHATPFDGNEYGIEWLRFDPDSPMPKLIQKVAHVAFQVDDLDAAVKGKKVLLPPNEPMPGLRIAFIEHEGAPVEFLQFLKK